MKIPAIKNAVEKYSIDELKEAEQLICNEQKPNIELGGDDEGENLTHALAAIWIKTEMQNRQIDLNTALRLYTNKVRTSIN
jgi:hypothetical protein